MMTSTHEAPGVHASRFPRHHDDWLVYLLAEDGSKHELVYTTDIADAAHAWVRRWSENGFGLGSVAVAVPPGKMTT